jgi:hypothetical protein
MLFITEITVKKFAENSYHLNIPEFTNPLSISLPASNILFLYTSDELEVK